jgi:hypothetical protein
VEINSDKKVMAPSWVSRGLHSESGGGRGLTARDAVCVGLRLAISGLFVQNFLQIFFHAVKWLK